MTQPALSQPPTRLLHNAQLAWFMVYMTAIIGRQLVCSKSCFEPYTQDQQRNSVATQLPSQHSNLNQLECITASFLQLPTDGFCIAALQAKQ